MSQPSFASSRNTPTVPTDTAGEAGNMVDAQDARFNSAVSAVQSAISGMTVPGPGHPANADGHGTGALGYQGFQDGELNAINNR
jgi:hypothetical protein